MVKIHDTLLRKIVPSGYLTVCHGKSPFLIDKPSINGPFSMAMLVITRGSSAKSPGGTLLSDELSLPQSGA